MPNITPTPTQNAPEQAPNLLASGRPIRFRTWWWGRFIQLRGERAVDESGKTYGPFEVLTAASGWEFYDETLHGAGAADR